MNFISIVGLRKMLAQIHIICNYNFLNSAFIDQNKFEWQRFNIKITLFLALFLFWSTHAATSNFYKIARNFDKSGPFSAFRVLEFQNTSSNYIIWSYSINFNTRRKLLGVKHVSAFILNKCHFTGPISTIRGLSPLLF